jgi:hypothetical protein
MKYIKSMSKSSTGKQIHQDLILKAFFENYDYQKDPEYAEWEAQLYSTNNKFTFEKTLDFCKIDWKFKGDWKEKTKERWLDFIREWNMIRYEEDIKDPSEMSTIGYVAVTYLYVVLPYDLLDRGLDRGSERSSHITEFQAKLINICMLHETGKNLDSFKDYDMLTIHDPPEDLDEFEQFLHQQYNTACWFLTFLIYLGSNKMGHKGAIWAD